MQLYTVHKVLIGASLVLSAVVVAWGLHNFTSQGEIRGAFLAGAGALSGVGLGYYLSQFIKKTKR